VAHRGVSSESSGAAADLSTFFAEAGTCGQTMPKVQT
jgi:hypothetical protein